MSARATLAVIFGGRSPEHEVSVVSARSIMREADPARFEAVPIGITRGGAWLAPAETRRRLEAIEAGRADHLGDERAAGPFAPAEALAALAAADAAFPIVHGRTGEDGALQGLLELAGVPYVGSGVAASAIGMDKARMRAAFAARGIPQPAWLVLRGGDLDALAVPCPPPEALARVGRETGYPCFVKPANGGSSVGVGRAASPGELGEAVARAARYDGTVLVEEAIGGREVECAILGGLGGGEPQASPLGEIRPRDGFYDYESKYGERGAELVVPAAVSEAAAERVRAVAVEAFRAIGAHGLARVDFKADGDDARVLEINTLPGFTPISMYPRLWDEAGVGYADLIARLVELALERHAEEAARA